MDFFYPERFPSQDWKFVIIYERNGIEDRGTDLKALLDRTPIAVYGKDTRRWTGLNQGHQRIIGNQRARGAMAQGDAHLIYTENIEDALDLLHSRYDDELDILDAMHY